MEQSVAMGSSANEAVKASNIFMNETIKMSYAVTIESHNQKMIAVDCDQLKSWVTKISRQMVNRVCYSVERVEDQLAGELTNIVVSSSKLESQQSLLQFVFDYCYNIFTKSILSKQLMRNIDFINEYDSLIRFTNYYRADVDTLTLKIEADLTKCFLDRIDYLEKMNLKSTQDYQDYKKNKNLLMDKEFE